MKYDTKRNFAESIPLFQQEFVLVTSRIFIEKFSSVTLKKLKLIIDTVCPLNNSQNHWYGFRSRKSIKPNNTFSEQCRLVIFCNNICRTASRFCCSVVEALERWQTLNCRSRNLEQINQRISDFKFNVRGLGPFLERTCEVQKCTGALEANSSLLMR